MWVCKHRRKIHNAASYIYMYTFFIRESYTISYKMYLQEMESEESKKPTTRQIWQTWFDYNSFRCKCCPGIISPRYTLELLSELRIIATYGLYETIKHTSWEMHSLPCSHDDSGSKEHAKTKFQVSILWIQDKL